MSTPAAATSCPLAAAPVRCSSYARHLYPILWVLTIAFSGGQSLAIADCRRTPGVSDRLRAITPWPEHVSLANFRSLFADQPFARWLLNSAIVAAATTVVGVVPRLHRGLRLLAASASPAGGPA